MTSVLTAIGTELTYYRRSIETLTLMVVSPIILVEVLSRALGGAAGVENPYQFTVPGFALLFSFYGASYTAEALFRERTWGNWHRLLSLPVGRAHLVLGKSLAPVALVTAQISLVLLYGALFHGVVLGSLGYVAVVVLLTAVTASTFGIILAAVAASQIHLNQLSNLLVLSLASLGGALVPVSTLPAALRHLAPGSPHYWALRGLRAALDGEGFVPDVAMSAVVLVGFGVGAVVVGLWLFRFERMLRPL